MPVRRRRQGRTRLTHRARAFIVAGGLLASSCDKGEGSETGSAGNPGAGAVSGASGRGSGNAAGTATAGSAGTSGGGASGAAGTGGCVDISHVDEMQTDSLDVIGSGFEAYEGQMIRIVATHGEPTYGLGEAPIREGSFELLLPGVLGDYTGLGIYVDTVRDDTCSPRDEILWQRTTGPASARGPDFSQGSRGETVWKVIPGSLRTFDQAGPCNINGIFDLAKPLPCLTVLEALEPDGWQSSPSAPNE
jgi:hypothetical protein